MTARGYAPDVADIDQLIAALLPEDLPKEGTWSYRVLMTVADRGALGATDDELAAILQAPGGLNNIRPRRNELVGEGLLVDTGEKRVTSSGKTASVWTLNQDLRSALWPRFTARDCEHAAAIDGVSQRTLTGAQRRWSDSLRGRLALLGRQARRAAADRGTPAGAAISDEEVVLTLDLIGADPGRASVIAHLDGAGLALVVRVEAAESEDLDQDEAARRQRLRDRLNALPAEAREPLASLGEDWEYVVVDDEDGGEEELVSSTDGSRPLRRIHRSQGRCDCGSIRMLLRQRVTGSPTHSEHWPRPRSLSLQRQRVLRTIRLPDSLR